MHSKMLMKLKGTFKIRLFQGSDWHHTRTSAPAPGSTAADSTQGLSATAAASRASREESPAGGAAAAGKSVRFKKEDLLRDLTAPASTTPGGSHAQADKHQHAAGSSGKGFPTARSGAAVPAGAMKGGAARQGRSSKPLFEVSRIP